jgi:UPF0176 protein
MADVLPLETAPIWVLAAYAIHPIADPAAEVQRHKEFLSSRDARARIYISHEGLNIQMSASPEAAQDYMEWLRSDERFRDQEFKIQGFMRHPFPRLTIKRKRQLVAVNRPVDFSKAGPHMSPAEWRRTLESGEDILLLDVRNHYEWEIGRFKGAVAPDCNEFRQFPEWIQQLKQRVDPGSKKVLMCCTGGIRCEFFSAMMREEGFEHVYQLQGGMLKYSQECGDAEWEGSLFVFDDRLTVPMGYQAQPISVCHHCGSQVEKVLNCANMDCNRLFICCPDCVVSQQGCCCAECRTSPRLRALMQPDPYQPFPRLRTGDGHLRVPMVEAVASV